MSESMTRAVRVRVSGEVQGVSFRGYAAREAVRLEVGGWIANAPDGTVVAVVEGDDDAVGAMLDWFATGSPAAVVEEVDVTDVEPTGTGSFDVRY